MRMTEVFLAIAAVIILIQQAVILAGRAKRKKAERLEWLAGLAASGDTHAQAELEHPAHVPCKNIWDPGFGVLQHCRVACAARCVVKSNALSRCSTV